MKVKFIYIWGLIMKDIGKEMYDWAIDLFPINRGLSGNGID